MEKSQQFFIYMKFEFSKTLPKKIIGILVFLLMSSAWALPEGFVYVDQVIPSIKQDIRYFGVNNFVGRPVNGYHANRAIFTKSAALALKAVQEELSIFGLGLLVFDAYRPQQSVDDFVAWSKNAKDTKTKSAYYPRVQKNSLFSEGYIAELSGHSRGSTIDLTIVSGSAPFKQLDMGTRFDFFGPESWPDYAGISPQQRANRLLLQNVMVKHGFKPYPQEWWHFTLDNEPFPKTYFDFPIR
ncbi:MAG: M15 family metallopeptidase [Polynucleobacter sp.]